MSFLKKVALLVLCTAVSVSCNEQKSTAIVKKEISKPDPQIIELDITQANRLSQLPIACIQNPLPYKAGLVIDKAEDLAMPQVHHPAFYGCFDWHSAVHGHWSLVYLLKTFPNLDNREKIIKMLDENLTQENIQKELEYFTLNDHTKSFERTYGWAWLLKLQEELYTWDSPKAQEWYKNLTPLSTYISEAYISYLPKLVYPIRVGEHSNTAFGLSFAYDYAITVGDNQLKDSIEKNALRFYNEDKGCPITWEPSGYDFLSPCLQEIDIMRKILDRKKFDTWLQGFMPDLYEGTMTLEPGKIIDRTDGKLVHLDGLNFSRAWCLYPLSENNKAQEIANTHLAYSLNKITDGDYAGQHWLASFALFAFKSQTSSIQ
jgi:hypothetical protein